MSEEPRLFTTAQLSRILDVPAAMVRSWTRQELIEPAKRVGRLCFYDFRQLTNARALQRLRDAGVRPRRIRQALEHLRKWAPDAENALAQLEALEAGGPLMVRTDAGRLAETSGQMRIEFDAEDDPVHEALPSLRALREPAPSWFEHGVIAEDEGRLDEAAKAYERAIALEGPEAELCFNLGNVLYALDRKTEAAARFREAVALEADYAEAWNNLGNALSDVGEYEPARAAFEQAIALAPGYADPHYNLAQTLAATDRGDEARAHWRRYLQLDPNSPWADEARKQLQ